MEERNKIDEIIEDSAETELDLEEEEAKEKDAETLEKEVAALRDQLEEKTREAEEYHNKFLRSRADFENYKKRVEKEKKEIREFANDTLIKELLTVIDNLERALSHINAENEFESLKEGVELTLSQMFSILKKFDLEQISAGGQKFDPNLHEALGHEESDDYEPETVMKELQKGYTLKGRLLRPARVIVSKEPKATWEE